VNKRCADAPLGHACNEANDCESDFCSSAGVCDYQTCNPENGEPCLDAQDCCHGGCVANKCCTPQGSSCAGSYAQCCPGFVCGGDTLLCETCRMPGTACSAFECCAPSYCNGYDKCAQPVGGPCVDAPD
jgi:hypothetical protein